MLIKTALVYTPIYTVTVPIEHDYTAKLYIVLHVYVRLGIHVLYVHSVFKVQLFA